MSIKSYNKKDVERILLKNGWKLDRCKGSHKIYRNNKGQHLTIGCCKYNTMVMRRLMKEYGLVE